MGNKCKICGYRFKDRDEAICPECFTARDDDISCERYSANEHSHGRSYSSELRDTGESFVQKELRQERNNQFARENFGDRATFGVDMTDHRSYNDGARFARNDYYAPRQQVQQPAAQQSAYQRYTAQVQRKQGGSYNGFTPAGQILAQRSTVNTQNSMLQGHQTAWKPSGNQKKKGNSAAAVIFLMFFVLMFAFVVISEARESQKEREQAKSSYTTQPRSTTTQRTTTASTTTQSATTTLNSKVDTTMGNYNCEIVDLVLEQKATSQISKELLSRSSDFTHQDDPWTEVTVKVRIKPGSAYTDIQKDTTVTNATLQCLEKSTAITSMSYSSTAPNEKIEVSGDGTEISVKLLGHKDAKLMYFNLCLKGAGEKESCRFRINV